MKAKKNIEIKRNKPTLPYNTKYHKQFNEHRNAIKEGL